jgi:hypothetical protein
MKSDMHFEPLPSIAVGALGYASSTQPWSSPPFPPNDLHLSSQVDSMGGSQL